MRALHVLTISAIVLATLPLAAAGPNGDACPTYTIFVGDEVAANEEGAFMVAAAGWYVFFDGPPVVNPWLLSLWVYEESNGIPGPQRSDEVCDQTNDGQWECDCTIP